MDLMLHLLFQHSNAKQKAKWDFFQVGFLEKIWLYNKAPEIFLHCELFHEICNESTKKRIREIANPRNNEIPIYRAYGDVIKDNTVMVDSDLKCLIGKFMRTARPAILAIYE